MSEPTITCPNCQTQIKLTESLAAPLIAATRVQYEKQIALKDAEVAKREQSLNEQAKQIAEEKDKLEEQVTKQVEEQLKLARIKVAEEERNKAKQASAAEIEAKGKELAEMQEILKARDEKLKEAQTAQAAAIKKERELDDAKRELELNVEKQVQAGLEQARASARKAAEEGLKLTLLEKDEQMLSMQKKIAELKQKAEQGSQQLQGEAQELELESVLSTKFIFDSIEPVPKGEFGGDALHRVRSQSGENCGTILWESKRTKHWSNAWLTKLRDDQRAANAEISVIVSQALPPEVETFDVIDGVWVISPQVVLPVATMLRQSLIQVSMAREASQGIQTKAEMVYQYLTGSKFRHRIEAIVEAFSTMQEDLDKERKVITRQWAKRGAQIEQVMDATVGMYGDLQGIAGQSLQEIEGMGLDALEFDAKKEGKLL